MASQVLHGIRTMTQRVTTLHLYRPQANINGYHHPLLIRIRGLSVITQHVRKEPPLQIARKLPNR